MEPNVELQRELTAATRDILARYDIYLRADDDPGDEDVEVVVPEGVAPDDTFEVARQISPADIGPIPEPEPAPDPEPAPASPWFAGSGQDWVAAPPWVDVKEDTGGSSAPKNPRSSAKPGAAKKRRSSRALTGELRTVNRGDGVDTTMLRKEPNGRSDDDVWLENEAEVETGQTVELLKTENDFAFVRTSDGDEGYVLATYLVPHEARRSRRAHSGGGGKRKSKRKSKKRKSKKRKSKRKTKKR
jgi:hypothetical protein